MKKKINFNYGFSDIRSCHCGCGCIGGCPVHDEPEDIGVSKTKGGKSKQHDTIPISNRK